MMGSFMAGLRRAAPGRVSLLFFCTAALLFSPGLLPAQDAPPPLNLAGPWKFRADPADVGVADKWFTQALPDVVRLPGSMAENGKGDDPGVESKWTGGIVDRSWFTAPEYAKYRVAGQVKVPFWLTPDKVYVGPAWYQKEIAIPEGWRGRRILLFLERCHWETRIWVDGEDRGWRNSLGAPHEYDLSAILTPGPHQLTIRVDNRIKDVDVGANAHSVSDHTQSNWNGIVGRIELRAAAAGPVRIEDVRAFPDVASKKIRLSIDIKSRSRQVVSLTLSVSARGLNSGDAPALPPKDLALRIRPGTATAEIDYDLGPDVRLWDEFAPNLYRLSVVLREERGPVLDQRTVQIGIREIKVAGTRFAVNGRPVFLRGTLECCIFPRTGYPPTDIEEWTRIFAVCRAHGLNHVRFHSWCPPEAAFDAADRAGVYLYVECCAWTDVGDGRPFDKWLYEESERIVRAYGNHPSFCMMSTGNEPSGKNQARFLGDFVSYWRKKDPRRLYTGAAGWPRIPENEFHVTPDPRIQAWGGGLKSVINAQPPRTDYDWRDIIAGSDKPVVGHEIGQWCVYPDFSEIPKYTGVLHARNFEIFRDTLEARGLGRLAGDFLSASGKLQALCYKADIEAALRTPGMAGFELLDLHDFPGQGTALVGVLNPFWEEKGYITAAEFRRFCGPTIPLARMSKLNYSTPERFSADLEVAHFGPEPLKSVTPEWTVLGQDGRTLGGERLPARDIPWGNGTPLGRIELPLAAFRSAERCVLKVKVGAAENEWDFFVFPMPPAPAPSEDILVARRLDAAAIDRLGRGGKVLLTAGPGTVRPEKGGSIAVGFSSIFWNTAWTGKQPPHTLGILCDPAHPALAGFPAQGRSNWQWWDAMSHAQAIILDDLAPGLEPIIRIIDDWFTNRSLGLVFEARVGPGRLLLTGIDLLTSSETRPEARQLLDSLVRYAAGPAFRPSADIPIDRLKALFRD